MTVDFEFKRAPAFRVGSIRWKGPWNEKKIRARFGQLMKWAAVQKVRTGKWIFREPAEREWEVCLELKGKARSGKGVRVKTLRAATVGRVRFDPEAVSPRVVYHGLSDWLRWRRKEGEIKSVVSTREVYDGDPWKNSKVWQNTEVQFVVRK
ncbi:MAG TPA: GyrI-like domain-containing protein [Thermoplasmata archaeon]|nr:GyrI-like domain-containing protein [Thermoplasmata archaeon]